MVTAPLGLVPRELEDLWPAAHYDIPVSGDWDADELEVIRSMVSRFVSRIGYSVVINHSGIDIHVKGTRVIDTRQGGSAGSGEALARLESSAESAVLGNGDQGATFRTRLEVMKSISRFIHGSDAWLEGTTVFGRPPILTIDKDGSQMAKWNPRMGRFSFSKSSLPLLDELGVLPKVSLREGVDWVGDIFSSNTESADGSIRVGDEILVFQGGKLIGSARAEAPGWEWPHGPGRLARARHRL
jgi:archaeosine synthase